MVIEVSYQGASESRDIYAHVKGTDYFETDDMPSRKAVARKLTADNVDFDESTLVVKLYKQDADTLRKANIGVGRF
jgi:hypothetical protein